MNILNKENLRIEGKYVNLREIQIEDAEFVLSLRCNEKKARFLHATENNLQKQIDYIKRYKTLKDEYYFIIENKKGEPIGTDRIYGIREDAFSGGSWLMVEGSDPYEVMEGEALIKKFGFETLKFNKCYFDVRKGNKKVLKYHKLLGSKIVGETDIDYLFEVYKDDYLKNVKKFLPFFN